MKLIRRWNRLWNLAALVAGSAAGLAVVTQFHPAHTFAGDVAHPAAATPPPAPTPRELIGLDALEARLGRHTPTGKGVVVGHVEGNGPLGNKLGDYMPNIADKKYKGVNLAAVSGASDTGGHAEATASLIFGQGGMAPGVEQGIFFASMHWLTSGYLHAGTNEPPAKTAIRVFSHSWIGGDAGGSPEILHRIDYAIDHDGVVMVVGVNNHRTAVPVLLCSAYNTISVGNWTGDNSGGYTKYEGEGRCKPELVGPMNLTSFSTPIVAACAARLEEAADRLGSNSPAHRSELIKAILMAGAEKPPGWKQEPGKPLDSYLGAGRLRIDHSFDILDAGQAHPGTAKNRDGWSFEKLKPRETHAYRFEAAEPLGEASLMLVWNRRIDGRRMADLMTGQTHWAHTPRLADFDLKLVALDEGGKESTAGASSSTIDNVEHVYLKDLPRGRYRIEVTRKDKLDEDWDYALAWRMEKAAQVKGP